MAGYLSKSLMQKRYALIEQMRAAHKRAKENGEINLAEVNAQFRAMMEDAQKLKAEATLEAMNGEITSLEESWKSEGGTSAPGGMATPDSRQSSPRDGKMDAFRQYLRFGRGSLSREELRAIETPNEYRDLSAGKDAVGGYMMVPKFGTEVLRKLDPLVVIRRYAKKHPLTQAGSLGFPTIEAHPDDSEWTTELRPITSDTSMEIGKREFVPHPTRKRILVSEFLLLNSPFSPESTVIDELNMILSQTQEKAFLLGNGVGKPLGVMVASNSGISTSRDVSTGNNGPWILHRGHPTRSLQEGGFAGCRLPVATPE